jgi:hypothetical protein
VFYVNPGKTVTIDGLTIANGLSETYGGGIYNDAATLTVTNCVFSGNFAYSGGGICSYAFNGSAALTVSNCTISGNLTGFGGGISNGAYNDDATLTVTNCTISDNSGGKGGGGIFNYAPGGDATLMITNSTISRNSGYPGGGIFSGAGNANIATLTITNSTISDNSGSDGGGIYNEAFPGGVMLTITNSTLSNNSAYDGGGIFNYASGDRARLRLTITNSTVSGNSADVGGNGISNYAYKAGIAAIEIGYTIFNAGRSGGNIFNIDGTVTSIGYNLSSDNGGGYLTGPGDQINTDPVLGPLQDNGGPTFTHALLPGSPAIDAGDPNFTPPPYYDQRGPGFDRVVNGRTDVGSFEVQSAPTPTPTPTVTAIPTATPTPTPTPRPSPTPRLPSTPAPRP